MVLDLIKELKDKIKIKLFVIKKNKGSIYDKEAKRLGIEIIYLNQMFKIFSFLTTIKLFKELKRYKPDIIHTHLKASTYVYFYYIFQKNFKWIHTVHTLANVDTKIFRRILFKRLYNNLKITLVAVSNTVKESIYALYKNANCITIYNGIDIKKFNSEFLNNDINIISIGRFSKVKNHEYMLEELKDVITYVNKVYLIGDGKLKGKINRLIKKYQMEDKIVIIKYTNRIKKYLQDSSIYISTSKYEGMSLAIIEALASGLIVISSVASKELVVNNYNGFLINLEKGELKDKLLYVIENFEKLNELRSNARRLGLSLSSKNMANQYLNLYLEEELWK